MNRLTMVVALITILLSGCNKFEEAKQNQIRTRDVSNEEFVEQSGKGLVAHLHYFKDSRTSLCFAYTWGGDSHGGPALTSVPCEAIPKNLLSVAQ